MSSSSNQVSQYKDALKLMKKKFQSTESQLNEMKAKYEQLQKTFIGFLEYATKPFDESNPQPDFTSDGLRCWWDIKKQGLFLESPNAAPVPVITNESSPSVLRSKIAELTAQLKKVEFEKRDLDFNLNRRTTDYKSLSEKAEQMKKEIDVLKSDLDSTRAREQKIDSTLTIARNQIMALFINLSQFLGVNCEKEEEIKSNLYSAVRQIFPEEEEGKESSHSDIDLVMLNAVDKISLFKSRHQSLQEELTLKSGVLASQSKQIEDLFSLSETDKETITHLRTSLEEAQRVIQDTAEQSAISSSTAALSRDEQLAEYEKANSSLRQALQSMRATMEQQQKRVEESENKYMKVQEELVTVQRSSSEMVQQMFVAGEEKARQIEEEKAKLQTIAEEATNEVAALRVTLEKTSKEYEHELAVLRERHYAVEEQVSVSEKFLDSTNRAHQKELHDIMSSKLESQRELQELRVQMLEKEEELRSCQESLEALRSQSREQVKVLTSQLRMAEQRMVEETAKVEEERRSLALSETQLEQLVAERVSAVEQKEKESSRMQQRQYEEEVGNVLVRTRKQVQVLSQQLEEERKNNRKARDQLGQISDLMTQQDRVIEKLRSEVASRESEIMAGKQQINMLSMIISQKRSD